MKLILLLLFIWVAVFQFALNASENVAPEEMKMGWPRLSDKTKIQLLLDNQFDIKKETIIFTDANNSIVELANGETLILEKTANQWKLKTGKTGSVHILKDKNVSKPEAGIKAFGGFNIGETFTVIPINREYGIERLTRSFTESQLSRKMFSTPEKTASYFHIQYFNEEPFIKSTYIKLVTDPEWNRILYGNLNHWIKSYDDVSGPTSIIANANGQVFVGETERQRISVLKIAGEGEQAKLEFQYSINGIVNPTDLALHNNGTPFNSEDDLLFVADASQNKILMYQVNASNAVLANEFEGFDSPLSIATGIWDGLNTNLLYLIDKIGRRVQMFETNNSSIKLMKSITGNYDKYFQSIKVDHFGNVYLVDNTNSRIFKYSPELELLDSFGEKEIFDGLANIDIPFGKVTIEGEGNYWVGFDQLFAIERWTNSSGAQRLMLGMALKNINFQTDFDYSQLNTELRMTDAGNISIRIFNQEQRLVRDISPGWLTSGTKKIQWDRRNEKLSQMPSGNYTIEIFAQSAYREEEISHKSQFYLPAYFWEDSGSENQQDNPHLTQGKSVSWGETPTLTANEHSSAIKYHFSNLDPNKEYQIAAEFFAGDGIERTQSVLIDGGFLLLELSFGDEAVRTDYLPIPKESYQDGNIEISFNCEGEGSALVSQVWFKESGADLNIRPLNENENIMANGFALEQNYPNPFNPTTTIRFSTREPADVELTIYDLLGRKVKTLLNENLNAGTHSAVWDGKNKAGQSVSSAIYFYRMKYKGNVQTMRMVLMR
jgi:flagellar hook assembly protein FlgD